MYTPLNISEQAIEKFGTKRIATWAYLRLRNPNGVVFGGYDQQRAGKTGWTRSTFFSRMAGLVESGLARKDRWGNWVLAPIDSIKQKHRCTLLLQEGVTEREVLDAVILKLVEQGHSQMLFNIAGTPKERISRRIDGIGMDSAKTGLCEIGGMYLDLDADRCDTVKLAMNHNEAPLNTTTLMRITGLGRSAMFAWKKRAKEKEWIKQRDRCALLRVQDPNLVIRGIHEIEEAFQGKVSYSCKLGGYVLNRASTYRLGVSYTKSKEWYLNFVS